MKDSENNNMLTHKNDKSEKNDDQTLVNADKETIIVEPLSQNEITEYDDKTTDDTYKSNNKSNDVYDYRQIQTQLMPSETAVDNQGKTKYENFQDDKYNIEENQIPKDVVATDSTLSTETMVDLEPKKEVNTALKEELESNISNAEVQNSTKKNDMQNSGQDSIIQTKNQDKSEILSEDKVNQKKNRRQKKRKKVKKQKYKLGYIIYSKRILMGFCLVSSLVAIYVGYLLFGSTSFEVLWKLRQTRNDLRIEVEKSRMDNAALQRKVLELKALEPK